MTKKEFRRLMRLRFENMWAELGIIIGWGAEGTTVYMMDTVKKLTDEQAAEVGHRILLELRRTSPRAIILDFTTRPPY